MRRFVYLTVLLALMGLFIPSLLNAQTVPPPPNGPGSGQPYYVGPPPNNIILKTTYHDSTIDPTIIIKMQADSRCCAGVALYWTDVKKAQPNIVSRIYPGLTVDSQYIYFDYDTQLLRGDLLNVIEGWIEIEATKPWNCPSCYPTGVIVDSITNLPNIP